MSGIENVDAGIPAECALEGLEELELSSKPGPGTETFLLHATSPAVLPAILEGGFNSKFTRRGAFGKGVYFGLVSFLLSGCNSSKVDEYTVCLTRNALRWRLLKNKLIWRWVDKNP